MNTDYQLRIDSDPALAVIADPVIAQRTAATDRAAAAVVTPASAAVVAAPEAVEYHTAGRTFAPDSFIAGIAGVGLLMVGAIAMLRAGVAESLTSPVVEVLGVPHTFLLGLIEASFGVLLLLAAAARSRTVASFTGTLLAIGGVLGAVQNPSFRTWALTKNWSWLLALTGAVVGLAAMSLARYRRESASVNSR